MRAIFVMSKLTIEFHFQRRKIYVSINLNEVKFIYFSPKVCQI